VKKLNPSSAICFANAEISAMYGEKCVSNGSYRQAIVFKRIVE